MLSSRTAALATDVDSTIVAVIANSQNRYSAACNNYVDHEALLTNVERDSIAAWRDRNNPWAKSVRGTYLAAPSSGDVSLSANVPNPFRESTIINYMLPSSAIVRIVVYDNTGQFIATLEAGMQSAGEYSIRWDGTDEHGRHVASGTYLLRLTTPSVTLTQKMEIVR
jgi:FlgD Ig-like domain